MRGVESLRELSARSRNEWRRRIGREQYEKLPRFDSWGLIAEISKEFSGALVRPESFGTAGARMRSASWCRVCIHMNVPALLCAIARKASLREIRCCVHFLTETFIKHLSIPSPSDHAKERALHTDADGEQCSLSMLFAFSAVLLVIRVVARARVTTRSLSPTRSSSSLLLLCVGSVFHPR